MQPPGNAITLQVKVCEYAPCSLLRPVQHELAVLLQPVLGDMLSDLPEISSFCLSERACYKSDPQTPYQHFLRRQPRGYESSMEARAAAADKAMQGCHDTQRSKLSVGRHSFGGIEQVSKFSFLCICAQAHVCGSGLLTLVDALIPM